MVAQHEEAPVNDDALKTMAHNMQLEILAGDLWLPEGHGGVEISGLTADSRRIKPGYLFAAFKGEHVDGARFVAQAVAAGASAILTGAQSDLALVEREAGECPVLIAADPRREFSRMAARFYYQQPETMVAVTGTSGKTSVAVFVRQIFEYAGFDAASLGTIGTVTSSGESYAGLTTPDPVSLHEDLARLASSGVTHGALEASSHGLDQRRLDGVRLAAAAFTNLGRDHLDYHPDIEDYLNAKLRLFTELLPGDGVAVVEPDAPFADRAIEAVKARGLRLVTVGGGGEDIALTALRHDGYTQILTLKTPLGEREVALPLAGRFQVSNALLAVGLAYAVGLPLDVALDALTSLKGAPGRLELIGEKLGGGLVFVDYAHKPDALDNALAALRPFAENRLLVLFGAGGDRDPGKRLLMGQAARRNADLVIVTDDNPRSEDPGEIRRAVLAGARGAIEIADRADAIRTAIGMLREGDLLCVAGKGHETGQIIGDSVLPFSDHEVIRSALDEVRAARLSVAEDSTVRRSVDVSDSDSKPLWTLEDFVTATGGRVIGVPAAEIVGISIDTRSLTPGEAFFAIAGERFDGHDFADDAITAGAALAVVSEDKCDELAGGGPYVVVDDVLDALRRLGEAARARTSARIVAITGSVGKTGTKEMLRKALARSGKVHASVASFNNHWGVPLTLARMAQDTQYGVFEIGMNHAGEITPLVKMVRPHVAIITTVQPVHLEFFGSVEKIAEAKAEIFLGLEPGGAVILNRDNDQFDLLRFHAKAVEIGEIYSFGVDGPADAQGVKVSAQAGCTCISGAVLGKDVTYKIGAPGRHLVRNSLAVLLAVEALGADLALGAIALAGHKAPKGRGAQTRLKLRGGDALVIDEAYNANPASVRAALQVLGEMPVNRPGRRIAVLGDMLELGETSEKLHMELLSSLQAADVDLVYCSGSQMYALWELVPAPLRGAYSDDAAGLKTLLLDDIRPGDVVMIKGSLGAKMGQLVDALCDEFSALDDSAD